jgi:O-antigen/teichoic acid export membrane protein
MARETEKERLDREIIELLNELRVTLPGVQVLFAFLLVLPFQAGFADVTDIERAVYLVAFLATTAATLLLIAPATYHRIQFRAGDKLRMLLISNRLVIAGTLCLGIAVTAAVFLISEVLLGDVLAWAIAAVAAVALLLLWYGLPISSRLREGSGAAADEAE